MFWCNLFHCENIEVDKLEAFIDTKEAGCNYNCSLCIFAEEEKEEPKAFIPA